VSEALRFEITGRSASCGARTGRLTTPHGTFETPAFMPVGTRASVKGLLPSMVAQTGAQILLGNTYHLMLRPGSERVAALGGLHRFMGWPGPILTDSGGFQVFSLGHANAIDEDGVTFTNEVSGERIRLTPERSMHVQHELGADVIMAFDDCPPAVDPSGADRRDRVFGRAPERPRVTEAEYRARLEVANERTVRWLERCRRAHDGAGRGGEQALFGIVQGGTDLRAREWSVERVCNVELPGYAIGGVAVGEGPEEIGRVVRHTAPLLPEGKPRYLMGVGYERDLLAAVRAGVDMFDCVLPTRNARNANAFTRTGQVRLRNSRFAEDPGPIEAGCDCPACDPGGWWRQAGGPSHWGGEPGHFSLAYIRHLFLSNEMLGPILLSLHNLRHFQRFMGAVRTAVLDGDWARVEREWPCVRTDPADPGA